MVAHDRILLHSPDDRIKGRQELELVGTEDMVLLLPWLMS